MTTHLPREKHLGPIDPAGAKDIISELSPEEQQRQALFAALPPLSDIMNLNDFEVLSRKLLPPKTWAYYSSAADDEISIRENHNAFQRVWFRPRVLRNVSKVDFSHTILGVPSTLPIYISGMALGRLGHPDGELNLTRAAGKHGIIQMTSTFASFAFDEIADACVPGQHLFAQLCVRFLCCF